MNKQLSYFRIIIYFFMFQLFGSSTIDQSASSEDFFDSLVLQSKTLNSKSQKAEFWLSKVEELKYKNAVTALNCLSHSFDLVDALDEPHLDLKYHYWQAWLRIQGDHISSKAIDSSRMDLQYMFELLQQDSSGLWAARTYWLNAAILFQEKGFMEAADTLILADSLADLVKYPLYSLPIKAESLVLRARIGLKTGESKKAEVNELFKQALEVYEKLGDSTNIAVTISYLLQLFEPQEADSLFNRAVHISKEQDSQTLLFMLNNSIGKYYFKQFFKNPTEVSWYNKSLYFLGLAANLPNPYKGGTWLWIAYNYHKRAAIISDQIGMREIYVDSAFEAYNQAAKYAIEEDNKIIYYEVMEELLDVCKVSKRCDEKKPEIMKLEVSLQDLMDPDGVPFDFIKLANRLLRSEKKINSQLERKNKIIYGAGAVLLFISVLSSIIYRRQQMLHKRKAIKYQLRALIGQLKFHFTANTMNVLQSHINSGRTEAANNHIIHFVRFYRKILNVARKKYTTLAREIELQESYLKLEQSGIPDELFYEIIIDPAVDLSSWYLPPMLINPFVENAVVHGVRKKQAPGKVTITVKRVDEDKVQCIIEDDGLGREKVRQIQEKMIVPERISHGISIAEEGVQLIKGASLDFEDIRKNGEVCGTRVTITLPKINPK